MYNLKLIQEILELNLQLLQCHALYTDPLNQKLVYFIHASVNFWKKNRR